MINGMEEKRVPNLYRKRIIPDECIPLVDDTILYFDDRVIVTAWNALHPKKDLHHGYSCYFLKEGFKVSKFLYEDDSLLYWYCDIIDHKEIPAENKWVFRDLLADVIIYPDGFVKVVDLDEFEQALESGTLTMDDVKKALRSLDRLLRIIYDGNFDKLSDEIEIRIPKS